jgi:hypothetical protein
VAPVRHRCSRPACGRPRRADVDRALSAHRHPSSDRPGPDQHRSGPDLPACHGRCSPVPPCPMYGEEPNVVPRPARPRRPCAGPGAPDAAQPAAWRRVPVASFCPVHRCRPMRPCDASRPWPRDRPGHHAPHHRHAAAGRPSVRSPSTQPGGVRKHRHTVYVLGVGVNTAPDDHMVMSRSSGRELRARLSPSRQQWIEPDIASSMHPHYGQIMGHPVTANTAAG